jgi:hypothetical protein
MILYLERFDDPEVLMGYQTYFKVVLLICTVLLLIKNLKTQDISNETIIENDTKRQTILSEDKEAMNKNHVDYSSMYSIHV